MSQKYQVDTDWKHAWRGSLATKITLPIMWVIVFFIIAASIIAQRNLENDIKTKFSESADQIAYQFSNSYGEKNRRDDGFVRIYLDKLAQKHGVLAISFGDDVTSVHTTTLPDKSYQLKRAVLIPMYDGRNSSSQEYLTFFYTPIPDAIKQTRTRYLLMFGLPLMLIGLVLAVLVHHVVTKPIQEMVKATHKVSEGDLTIRLGETRHDEFGDLARFFNKMLESLQSKQKELTSAVKKSEVASQAKSAFIANMSHELRTPLNAIIGYTEIMRDEATGNQHVQYLEDTVRVLTASHHLLKLINDVLDLSKIEAGKMELEVSHYSVIELCDEVIKTTLPLIRKNNNHIEVAVDSKIGNMVSDIVKIRQILFNLLSNAAKFTENGKIEFKAYRESINGYDWITFVISDNGIGMSDEQLVNVFHEFTQGDISTTRKYGGTGLGLALSRRYSQLLGGEIDVSSKIGVGSVFTVTIPVVAPSADEQAKMELGNSN